MKIIPYFCCKEFDLMKKIVCVIAALVCLCSSAAAQNTSDLGAWLNLQATGSFGNAYALFRAEYRAKNGLKSTDSRFMVFAGGYRFTPWLSADLGYEMWGVNQSTIHKGVLTVNGVLRRDALNVSLREKYELSFAPDGSTGSCLRSRLRAQYSFATFRPYLASELFSWAVWQRALFYVGTEIALSKHSTIDVFYCYHMPNGAIPISTLGLGYYFNFSL